MTRNDDKNVFTINIVIWAIKIMGLDGDKYVYLWCMYVYIYIETQYVYLYGIWLDWPTTWYVRVSKDWRIAELMVDYQIWRYSKYPICRQLQLFRRNTCRLDAQDTFNKSPKMTHYWDTEILSLSPTWVVQNFCKQSDWTWSNSE